MERSSSRSSSPLLVTSRFKCLETDKARSSTAASENVQLSDGIKKFSRKLDLLSSTSTLVSLLPSALSSLER
jgi:hypothetical protein